MNLDETLKQYSTIPSFNQLSTGVDQARRVFPEEIAFVLPSLQLGSEGPHLASMFLVSKNYICEVFTKPDGADFDFVAKASIRDYRVKLASHLVKTADGREILYQTAEVDLLHVGHDTFRTRLRYVGENAKGWLATVLEAIPIATSLVS